MKAIGYARMGKQWRKHLRGRVAAASRALAGEVDLHTSRVRLKQARAMVKLGQATSHKRQLKTLNRELRDVGKPLSCARDGEVLLAAAKQAGISPRLIALLQREQKNALQAVERKRASLRAVLRRILERKLPTPRRSAMFRGLALSKDDARRAMRAAEQHPGGRAFHELRKRCKDLRYQYELLGAVLGQGKANAKIADRVSNRLGKAHDLRVLEQWLSRHHAQASVRPRVRKLEAEALRLAKGLFDGNCKRKLRRGPRKSCA
jgi:CHAD domain-containing protein